MFVCLFASIAFSQVDRATLSGVVRDPSGAPAPGVTIMATERGSESKRQTLSTSEGEYALSGLPVGTYEVTMTLDGFKRVRYAEIPLLVGQSRRLDSKLEVGGIEIAVEVTADAPIERDTAAIGEVISREQLENIPMNGRHWATLMALAPGAGNTDSGSQNSIRVFGRARDDNNWTLDGVDATGIKDPRQEGALRLVVSSEAVEEFRVASTSYGAESGTGAGAQVNLVSRRGSNDWTGSAFWYLRDERFDSRRVLDPLPEKPQFSLDQFGGSFGGPIVKDKTFFFVTYEGLRQTLGTSSEQAVQVPSASLRARALATSPALKPLIDAFPVGTAPTANADVDLFVGRKDLLWNEDSFLARIDHRFSDTFTMFARYNKVDGDIDSEVRSGYLETRASDVNPENFTVQAQKILSSEALVDLRVGYNHSPLERRQQGLFAEGVEIVGVTSGSTQATQITIEDPAAWTVSGHLAMNRGRSHWKIGGEYRQIRVDVGQDTATTLRFASAAAFVSNTMNRVRVTGDLPTASGRRWYGLGWIQNDLKLSSTLTANLGVRYEYYSVMTEKDGRGRLFDVVNCFPRTNTDFYCPPGTSWYEADKNNVAPRFGLSWSITPKTVVRGSFGIFFSPGQNDDVMAAVDNIAERSELTGAGLRYPVASVPSTSVRPSQPRSLQRDRKDMEAKTWTVSLQRDIGAGFVGQVAYVGSHATNVFTRVWVNAIDPATGRQILNVAPLNNRGLMDEKGTRGESWFKGLQASLTRSYRNGLLLQAQYMLSEAEDTNAGNGEASQVMISSCVPCDRGPSDFDIRHTFTFNGLYRIPFGAGRSNPGSGALAAIFGNWDLSGVVAARTGRPVNITITRVGPDGGETNQRPNLAPGVEGQNPNGGVTDWLNPAAFVAPAAGQFGNVSRNAYRAPGAFQIDLGLARTISLSGRATLLLRVEGFNVLDRNQYGSPSSNISQPLTFGVLTPANSGPTGTGTARSIQLSARLGF